MPTFFAVEGEERLSLVLAENVLEVARASQGEGVNPGPSVSGLSAVGEHRLTRKRGGVKGRPAISRSLTEEDNVNALEQSRKPAATWTVTPLVSSRPLEWASSTAWVVNWSMVAMATRPGSGPGMKSP